jgi:hypothetical protein
MKIAYWICIALGVLVVPHAWADGVQPTPVLGTQEVQWVRDPEILPYSEAYKFFLVYDECPRMQPRFRIRRSGKIDISNVRIELIGGDISLDIPVDPTTWTVDVPRNDAALKAKAEFMVNQHPHVLRFEVDATVRLPDGLTDNYAHFLSAVTQANKCENKVVPFAIRMVRRNYNALAVRMPAGGKISIDTSPAIVLEADVNGNVIVPFDPKIESQNPMISFSAMPIHILPFRQ